MHGLLFKVHVFFDVGSGAWTCHCIHVQCSTCSDDITTQLMRLEMRGSISNESLEMCGTISNEF